MKQFLPTLGFTNVSFPPVLLAKDLDIDALLDSGIVSSEAYMRILCSPEKGPRAVAAYLANALGHLQAIRACASGGYALCGVFEDDLVAPAGVSAAREQIAAAISELPVHADTLYLEACYEDCGALAYSSSSPHLARLMGPFCSGAVGHLATRARLMLQSA
jgi:hypothetical protein